MKTIIVLFLLVKYCTSDGNDDNKNCIPSITTVSGTHAPKKLCSEMLIFEDKFDRFDLKKWKHENTLSGGGNWEFQWYTNNRSNSFVKNKILYMAPTLLKDQFGEEFLKSGTLNVHGGSPADRCTNPAYYGCERTGTPENILNPIKSVQISTIDSFRFKYGKVEILAKMASGDWLWPAMWMMPIENTYGPWPSSGDIVIAQLRGNKNLTSDGVNIGIQQINSGIRFGPYRGLDTRDNHFFTKQLPEGFDTVFKKYQVEWTPDYIQFSINNHNYGKISAPKEGGFWKSNKFDTLYEDIENPWKSGTKMAPFDREFYIIMNLAVGGMSFFPDDAENPNSKPWKNDSPTAMTDFYNKKKEWIHTWEQGNPSLQINYVKVWAI